MFGIQTCRFEKTCIFFIITCGSSKSLPFDCFYQRCCCWQQHLQVFGDIWRSYFTCSCPCCCSCLPCKDIYRSTEASLAILPLFAFHHVCRSEASLVIQKHHCFDTKPGFILHTSEHTSKTTIRFIFFRVIVPLEGFKIRNAAGEWWVLWSWKYGHESGS